MPDVLIAVLCRFALLGLLLTAGEAVGQELTERDGDLADRPIAVVRVVGADPADLQLVENNIRAAVGDPYEGQTVRDDVSRLYQLARFSSVTAEAALEPDGSVAVIFTVVAQPPIRAVQTVGNKAFSDQELRQIVQQVPGGPRDQYLIEKAKRDIKALYRRKGYYLTDVTVDATDLDERGILIFKVIEGPRVKVKAIEFEGATAFVAKQLSPEIKTRAHMPLFRKGVLDEDVLTDDEAAIDRFYKDRGYLDVRIGHRIALSPENTEAKVTFLVSEGRRFTLQSVQVENLQYPGEPLTVFSPEQIAALLEIKTGDVYSRDLLRKSIRIVEDAYGIMGHLDVVVAPSERRSGPEPAVDLVLGIDEGGRFKVGTIQINGNFLTKDKVIRRLLRVKPGRPYDTVQLRESEQDIRRTRLFNDVRVTVQEPDPLDPEYRDLLIEVKERNTGSVNFGLAVGSDSGVFGEFSLQQDNFDIADVPASLSELVKGRALRGAGQSFNMTIRPGNEIFQYLMSLTEPHLFESDYSLSLVGSYYRRVFSSYDQERLTARFGLGRSLGDIWKVSLRGRFEDVQLSEIDADAPVEVYLDQGPDTIAGLGITLTRTTVGTITRPGRGSRLELSIEQIGTLFGDFSFTNVDADYTVFLTLDEDFLGRRTTLKLNSRVGYIFGGRAPTYERFYLGGRSFRGFEFRTVSPKGLRADTLEPSDEPVGGNWLLFFSAQYEFPLFQEAVSGVFFVDTGTVAREVTFDPWRLSVGAGIRLYIPALGPVPIAFDFGFPIMQDELDEERVLSFSAELPF